jgi:putative transcriptional regulator
MHSKLKELRIEQGWSQAELGQRLSVSRQAVNAIENSKHDPSLSLAFKISDLFGKSIEDIFDAGT